MKIKRFFAKDMRTALKEVKEVLGPNAVIMSNKKVAGGIELVAAVDEDAKPVREESPQMAESHPLHAQQRTAEQTPETAPPEQEAASVSDSLSALLQRQKNYVAQQQSETAPTQPQQRPEVRQEQVDMNQDAYSRAATSPPTSQSSPKVPDLSSPAYASEFLKNDHDDSNRDAFESSASSYENNHLSTASNSQENAESGELLSEYRQQMSLMQQEMASIKSLLTHQVSGLMWQELERREPTRALLIKKLQKLGLSEQLADQLASFVPDDASEKEAWQLVTEALSSKLATTNNEVLGRGGVFAMVGPTGVGKTTTIAKLAACFAQLHGAENLALVTTDTYRIGAHEQLATFGRIIGCPVRVAKNAQELQEILQQFRNKKLVLIDTAGMSQRDLRLSEQLSALMKNSHVRIKSYLVLSATVQRSVIEDTVSHFKRIPLSGCIFTKVDECMSLGELISVVIQNALPIGYMTNGQRVPEDLEIIEPAKLVEQAKIMFEKNTSSEHIWFSDVESRVVGMYD